MPNPDANVPAKPAERFSFFWFEVAGIAVLAALVIYFLKVSWRKWPDPIVDFGQQCYCIWQLSQGALFNHDFAWNYGPFSLYFEAAVFRLFGPGIMVLAILNLVIYALILGLAYAAFRLAWGRLAAFTASAVFISVFSFSHLLAVGNYNYVTPYAGESTQGMLLILVAAFIVVKGCSLPSPVWSFGFGLCAGLATVIKPEFMLAIGMLGIGAFWLRRANRQPLSRVEYLLALAGLALPTVAFTLFFARQEPWKIAFMDASRSWWAVAVDQIQRTTSPQDRYSGFNQPLGNFLRGLKYAGVVVVGVGAIWSAGWMINRPVSWIVRISAMAAAGVVVACLRFKDGWIDIGRSFPLLMVIILLMVVGRLRSEVRRTGATKKSTVMAFCLVTLALAMLARMIAFAHIYHLGFFQAALAGMVLAACLISWAPGWVGEGWLGRVIATAGCGFFIVLCCATIAAKSNAIRADQTESVGWGRDRFFATTSAIDRTGALVNWAAEKMRQTPPEARVLVLPDGLMINYLSRRRSVERPWLPGESEERFVKRLEENPPEHVIFISRNLKEFGIQQFGAEGNLGREIVKWVANHYSVEVGVGGDPLLAGSEAGAMIMRRKSVSN